MTLVSSASQGQPLAAAQSPAMLAAAALSVDIRARFRWQQQDVGARRVMEDICFTVPAGRFVALVGESGSGKSLLTRTLLGLLEPSRWEVKGDVTVRGKTMLSLAHGPASDAVMRKLRRQSVAAVFQEPTSYLDPAMRIWRQLKERSGAGARESLAEALAAVQLVPDGPGGVRQAEDYLRRFPHQLSLGQQQRVMLAMALALGTFDVVVADEPTASLDPTIQKAIVELVRKMRDDGRLPSLLLITHDLRLVKNLLADPEDEICFLAREAADEPYRIASRAPAGAVFHQGNDGLPPFVQEQLTLARSFVSLGPAPPATRVSHLVVERLVQAYAGGLLQRPRVAVRVEGLKIAHGEVVGIVGESGCGKSTLVRAVARLQGPAERGSRILYHDGQREVDLVAVQPDGLAKDRRQMAILRRDIQIIFQDAATSFNPELPVGEMIQETVHMVGSHGQRSPQELVEDFVQLCLELNLVKRRKEMATLAQSYPEELSAGQRQRLALARALVVRPALLIADEPFTNVDRATVRDMVALLQRQRNERGMTVLLISHDLSLVLDTCERVVVMAVNGSEDERFGTVVATGTPDEIRRSEQPEIRELLAAILAV